MNFFLALTMCNLCLIVAGWTVPTTPEVVAFVTASLVCWNTYSNRKQSKVVDEIHTLTNSAMGAQLKLNVVFAEQNAVKSRRIAELTKEGGDIAEAQAANIVVLEQRRIYQEHLMRQAVIDMQHKTQ